MFTSFEHCIFNKVLHYRNTDISSISNGVIISRIVSLLRIITVFDLIKWIKIKANGGITPRVMYIPVIEIATGVQ